MTRDSIWPFIAGFLCGAWLAMSIKPSLAHDADGSPNWITQGKYVGPDNVHCCGPADCFEIARDDISITPQGYVLKTYGNEIVPFSQSTPSEDRKFWRCKAYDGSRRCFFAPYGGS